MPPTSATPISPLEARALFGLAPDAPPEALIGAFRAAAKLAHPDHGGDAEQFRRVLEAYRLLLSRPLPPAPTEPSASDAGYVEIDPLIALSGGEAEAVLADGRRARLRVPAGARHGERLGLAGEAVAVRLIGDAILQARGSDLWLTVMLPARLLAEGGRARIETPFGVKLVWISRKVAERRLVRLEGQGLPARGPFAQGSLFLRLTPDAGAPESAARTRLRRFAAAWAA
jgi:curved DNA-binding protein